MGEVEVESDDTDGVAGGGGMGDAGTAAYGDGK